MEQQLFTAVTSTSTWLDDVETTVFSGSVLLAENAETQLHNQEVQYRIPILLPGWLKGLLVFRVYQTVALWLECPPWNWEVGGSIPTCHMTGLWYDGHTKDCRNGTQCIPAWHSRLDWGLNLL